MGFDEVCDNQRWAITKILNGQNTFMPDAGRPHGRQYESWAGNQRKKYFRTLVQGARQPKSAQCQVEEFPMGDLQESGNNNPQACRLVNGPANMKQGDDYKAWKSAQWRPCSRYRVSTCNKAVPSATW